MLPVDVQRPQHGKQPSSWNSRALVVGTVLLWAFRLGVPLEPDNTALRESCTHAPFSPYFSAGLLPKPSKSSLGRNRKWLPRDKSSPGHNIQGPARHWGRIKLPGPQRPVTLPGEVTQFAFTVESTCTSFVGTFLEAIIPPMYNGEKRR